MKVKILQATIVNAGQSNNGQKRDILISNGRIEKIADSIQDTADKIIEGEGLCVSIGWIDMRVNFRDPGNEVKEDLDSGLVCAANGGFTHIALSPDTEPPVDQKSMVKYTTQRAATNAVSLTQIGTLSKNMEGKNLSEMYDMHLAGARAFGDAKRSLKESGLLQRALLYTKNFDAPIFHFPYDGSLSPNGQMNEGGLSTQLGLKGMPSIAEEMVVRRDLTILEYTEGRLHLGPISSGKSVALIADAKKAGLRVTCETTAAHLAFAEVSLEDFDSFFKLQPPLRSEQNKAALIDAVKSGDIDVISSDHLPEDEEHKKLEFDFANEGQANLETFFPLLWDACHDKIELDILVKTFTLNPRQILGLDIPEIAEGAEANLTVFSSALSTSVNRANLQTKAYNVLPNGLELKGKVFGIFSNGQYVESKL